MRYDPINITTVIMLALTLFTIGVRLRSRPDANWPMIYYLFLVAYHQYRPGALIPLVIYISVISSLFLRFEFLGGFFRWVFVTVECLLLTAIAYQLYDLIVV